MFDEFLGKDSELKVPAAVAAPAVEDEGLSAAAVAQAAASAATRHGRAVVASWSSASVSSESKSLLKAVDVTAEPDDPTRVVTADTPSRRADSGTAWGALIHGLLEHALRHDPVSRDDLRRLAMWLTVDEPQLRPHLDEAVATVQAVSHKELWAEAKASPECHEEVPFAIKAADEGAGVPKVLNGTIDSVFREGEGWKIVDYKTDLAVTAQQLDERYGKQMAAYVGAWKRFVEGEIASQLVAVRQDED